jgi:xanthine dehydrogenase YagS FAD-binding subunit
MRDFEYRKVDSVDEAVAALRDPSSVAIAGGTELLNWIRLGIADPATLVEVEAPPRRISLADDVLSISAGTTLGEAGDDAHVRRHATALSEACLRAASVQIRNRATLGGNVLQKTRCAYFRSEAPLPWGCNKRTPGSGCAARHGLNERHAILGWTDECVATHPSDPAVALACLDAEMEIAGPDGRRTLPITAFHLTQSEATHWSDAAAPAHAAQRETRLRAGELIVGYRIPVREGERSAYIKVRERESYEYALVSAAAAVVLDGDVIRSVRLTLGSVAQKPWRLSAAESALRGQPLTRDSILPPIRAALSEARPLEHNGYKITMAVHAAARALLRAGGAS